MPKPRAKELGKIIEYILLYRPDEFGLFLNPDGSLPIKELMWALHEEEGWKHVRIGHIRELVNSGLPLAFSAEESHIEPKVKPHQAGHLAVPPKLLFFGARRKAYPVILKHGLRPGGRPYVPLATTEEMALRIGRRRDPKPVLLTVQAAQALKSEHQFLKCGELLYLVDALHPRFLSGPALKEQPETRKPAQPKPPSTREPEPLPTPGSFLFDPSRDLDHTRRQRRKEKEKRTRQRRQERRRKRRS